MFTSAPFPRAKEEEPARKSAPAPETELPFDAETIEKNRNSRIPYLEAREAVELEQKEMKAVKEKIGAEIREMCLPEIDEYVDCCVGRIFSIMACKKQALVMRKCLAEKETPEFIKRRTAEILAEREAEGASVVNNASKGTTRQRRAQYNRAILPEVDDPSEFLIRKPRAERKCREDNPDIE
eukprot:TRINITY_DN49303_c0_g1_i1.p2 TRINITY_DN49303_c0_g1~~TRINITY_DN49303_c0_g1_i1.p2  ORF type:complete len:193 (+),score=47.52 TRINITY_DN49303_c0_g1_i1:35-580(+)